MEYTIEEIEMLNNRFERSNPEEVLKYFLGRFGKGIALSSSLSIEDQALTDMMLKIDPRVRIFTLDTGRLFPETYRLIDRTNERYKIRMEVFCPQAEELQRFVHEQGINPFYESIEKRHACCQIRKLEPLKNVATAVPMRKGPSTPFSTRKKRKVLGPRILPSLF